MKRRYSLVEALIVEGVLEDRIQQARAKAESLLNADPATIPARDRNEYARSNAIIQFLDRVQSPDFPAASKNIGYLNWGIAKIKECADAEINTIAEEVSILIQAHTELKGNRQISPTIDDYTTLGALRSAVEEVALSRQAKSFEAEGKKAGKEMLDAAIRMSDILLLEGSIVADEEGLKSFSPESTLVVIAPKTRVASQVIGNPRTFGINTLGGPVRWCTSSTAFGNQYCNYTVNSNVFIIYVVDLTKQDKDTNQKLAFVFSPADKTEEGAGRGKPDDLEIGGKPFKFQIFDNLDSSGAQVTKAAMNSLGKSTYDNIMGLIQDYISDQGGVPHLSKKAEQLAAGSSDPDFIKSVASEELPVGYGVEALYDTIISQQDYRQGVTQIIPSVMSDLITRDNIDRRAAARLVNMFSESSETAAAKHFFTYVEDVKSVAEATLISASNADDPRKVKNCLSLIGILASRQDVDDESRRIIEDAQGKVDLLMAQAIGRLPVDSIMQYKEQIKNSRYPLAIVNAFVPAALYFMKDPKNIKQSNLEKMLDIAEFLIKSPGAAGNRQLPLKMIPLNSAIIQNVAKQIANLIQIKAFSGAKNLANYIMKTSITGRPELQKLIPALTQVVDAANDRFSRNNIIIESSDDQEVIDLINDPTMTRYLDVFDNINLTDSMMQAAYDRAVSEGDDALGDMLTSMIANPGFLSGEALMMRMTKQIIDQIGEDGGPGGAAKAVLEAFGIVLESRRSRSPVVKESRRKRYSLAKSLLGY